MNCDFFYQWQVPIDASEIGGFDILGLPEVMCAPAERVVKLFQIKKSFTISEIIKYCTKNDSFTPSIAPPPDSCLLIADMKNDKIIEAVKELKEVVVKEFSEDIKKLSGNIVQFVEVPLCFLDYAPGSTQISFSVFTKRILGVQDEKS
jgi:hypothetical protein